MPLVIKDYIWEETPKTVAISVPLKGVKKDKVNILSSDEFLKVSLEKGNKKKSILLHLLLMYQGIFSETLTL